MTLTGSEPGTTAGPRVVRAARGSTLTAKSWQTEAPLRMLMNNLDPEVAERPEDLVVYGGTGRAARSWAAYDAIVRTLEGLEADETLLVQSGKPVGVFRTHEWAPRVLIANSNLVGDWANWPEFRRLEQLGLTMYGQMTAGSWIYIGTQGILQGTYETFAAVAAKLTAARGEDPADASLAGTLTLTGGAGGMGGAQPLAVTLNGGAVLVVDVDPARLARRVEHRYLDEMTHDLDDAVARVLAAKAERRALSVGLVGNAATVFAELLEQRVPIDIVTDQTSAHDPLSYLPEGVSVGEWQALAAADPAGFTERSRAAMAKQVAAMVGFQDAGAEVFDYGNSIRREAELGGYDRAFAFPGFVPAYIRPLFAEGKGPFRWVALSGDPEDIAKTDRAVLELFPEDAHLRRWIEAAGERVAFEGLPARICWLGYQERHLAGLKFNEMVASGELSAPIVIGRDHLDSGSVASPYRETEAMADGSDAIADWPLLNALLNTASGATWVSLHHGGGVGIGRSIHAGQVIVADGTALAAEKIARVLVNDPGTGVMRHVDAGYERAREVAHDRGLRVPMEEGVTDAIPSLEADLAELAPIGRDAARGGWSRHLFDDAETALRAWFVRRAAASGLTVEVDRNTDLWAWWGEPADDALVTGSHLDSVPGGGELDGPLGVLSAFAAVDRLRAEGFSPSRPIAVVAFAEEEGSRFGLACLASKLLSGALEPAAALALTDAGGVSLEAALRTAGFDPARIGRDEVALRRIGAFVELHVEQGRALADLDAPVGVATAILAHGRWRLTFTGRGDHAGTTPMRDRLDPVVAAARATVAIRDAALAVEGLRATVGRTRIVPGGTNVIAREATLWLDARGPSGAATRALVERIGSAARSIAAEEGCALELVAESWTSEVRFDADLRRSVQEVLGGVPELPTGAGHDAGVLAARVPTAMLFVRNPTGVSHAPGESASPADRAAGVDALAAVLRGPRVTVVHCARLLGDAQLRTDIRITADAAGRITSIETDVPARPGDLALGTVVPGMGNAHSHAFHRVLRGRTHDAGGDFWSWRRHMYAAAQALDPDSYRDLATAVFGELVQAGWTAVGEFHYVHHRPDGTPYPNRHAMAEALLDAAEAAGIRLVLLDTLYLTGGIGVPLAPEQRRFGDGSAGRWLDRWHALDERVAARGSLVTLGAAVHSVRAVPPHQLRVAAAGLPPDVPLHAHVSEQPLENTECLGAYGVTPVRLLADAGALSPRFSAVHATHLTDEDIALLADSGASVVLCPTTEADLGDGIGPAEQLAAAGVRLALGSDQHAVVDPFRELQAMEAHARLAARRRGVFSPQAMLTAASTHGYESLGLPGGVRVGGFADLVELDPAGVRTVGAAPEQLPLVATSDNVRGVVVGGRLRQQRDTASMLEAAITAVDHLG